MKRYLWVIPIIIFLALLGYYLYYQRTIHDYYSCLKAGGQSGQDNEHFYCQINGKWYWNNPPAGTTE